ncbi:hypothetical protein ACSTKA_23150 [Vibrio parahaemolyticus]|uniref:hypothetical protein n=1 Tax=Pseudomonadota TaxID=1224 RepID=UPI003CEF54EC
MSEWIEWKGGEIPVDPLTIVEYRVSTRAVKGMTFENVACKLKWSKRTPIIAYRVVKEKEEC